MARYKNSNNITREILHLYERSAENYFTRLEFLQACAGTMERLLNKERVLERWRWHPCTDCLRKVVLMNASATVHANPISMASESDDECAVHDAHVFQDHIQSYFDRDGLEVPVLRTTYNAQRDVVVEAEVIWHARDVNLDDSKAWRFKYTFSRKSEPHGHARIHFRLQVGECYQRVQDLLVIEMLCNSTYPRDFYEDNEHLESDDDKEENESKHEYKRDKHEANEKVVLKPSRTNKEGYTQQVLAFEFHEDVFEAFLAQAPILGLEPMQWLWILLAVPAYEDEWMIDDRITEILFGAQDDNENDASDQDDKEATELELD